MSFPLITSPQNERVKTAAKLRDRKGRERQGKILIDGIPEICRAIDAGVEIAQVFALVDGGPELQAAAEAWQRQGIEVTTVAAAVMEKLAYGQRQELAVAVAVPPETTLNLLTARIAESNSIDLPPLVLVLEGVEKPGNLGAIMRTADACGVTGVVVVAGGTDLFNPNAIRASRGAIFHVPVASAAADECLAWLRSQGLRMFAARVDGRQDYAAIDYRQPVALILGSEAHGLTDQWHAPDIAPIVLPMLGVVDSLNLSVTAAVLCYEVVRQRQTAGLTKGSQQ